MKTGNTERKRLTFRTNGRPPLSCFVNNPKASLGSVAAKAASKLNVAGAFEILDSKQDRLSPETHLEDLPESDITLSPNLTPALK